MCITNELPEVEAEHCRQGTSRKCLLDRCQYVSVQVSRTLSFPENGARDLAWVGGCRKPHCCYLTSYAMAELQGCILRYRCMSDCHTPNCPTKGQNNQI
jgi:hypothetical protein